MKKISMTSRVVAQPSQDVVFCDLGGEVALLHVNRGMYYGLNTVGARIWHLINEACPVSEVRDVLVREFAVEEPDCERDLLDILQDMANAQLIKVQ